jgi:glycosyltransferase involved in cell wall biosynthesis
VRILLINNLFHPEPNHLKGLEFAKELQRRGHYVRVLTGFPNYPGGRIYPGYRARWTLDEEVGGVPVTRVAMYASHDASALRRIASYVSIALSQAVHALRLGERFDVAHVYMGPITLMWPARVLRALQGTKIVADVQDLWPESVTGSGMLGGGLVSRLLAAWCRRSYASADRVVVLSPGYAEALGARGVGRHRIEVVYNWCDERGLGADGSKVPTGLLDPSRFNVLYAGNMGKLQGLDAVLDAAVLLGKTEPRVRLVLVGGGVDFERLRVRAEREGLTNVQLHGRVTVGEANALQQRADALLINLVPTPLTRIGIPQKLQAYMAAGRPILLAAEGDAAALLARARAGVNCRPNDATSIADGVLNLATLSPAERDALGKNGSDFYRTELSFRRGLDRILEVFSEVTEKEVR